jgi:hypothetical protein
MEEESTRGPVLTTFAFLFALLAISNLRKPFSGGRAGFVFFGTKTSGLANAILAPAFGIFLLIYVVGIWRQKRWAVADGLGLRGLRAYQPVTIHDQDSAAMGLAVPRPGLYSDRARRFVGFRNPAYSSAAQFALNRGKFQLDETSASLFPSPIV